MRTHSLSEAIFAKYNPKPILQTIKSMQIVSKSKRGATLKDLYDELNIKQNSLTQSYQAQNADEIESMMIQNRRLIEAKRKPKR